jgi:hypothetical protein
VCGGFKAVSIAQESAVELVSARCSSVVEELRLLPRGRGVLADDIGNRVGPQLRGLLGIESTDGPGVVRRKVAARLTVLADRLPEDLGHAVRAALALGDVTTDRFLKDRVGHLAVRIQRDPRTAKRRVDEGLRRLAEMLVDTAEPPPNGGNPFAPEGWYIKTLHSVLLLDREPPRLIERRRIIATRSGLDRVLISLSAPSPGNHRGGAEPPVRLDVLQGGALVDEDYNGSHYRGTLRLPGPLAMGEEQEFTVAFRSRPRREMRPYYALTPFRPCKRFQLTVRFDPVDPPASVWRLDGVPPRMVTDFDPGLNVLDVNAVGEIGVAFSDLRPGLAYGVGWSAGDDGGSTGLDFDG